MGWLMPRLLRPLVFVAILALPVAVWAQTGAVFPKSSLTIETADGKQQTYDIELAITGRQQMQGLMHRTSMALDAGMLFYYGKPQIIRMWMRNTIIPLDMVFVDEKGVIVDIAKNTVPFSEEVISSKAAAVAVLELNAGIADAKGIKEGDILRHALLGNVK